MFTLTLSLLLLLPDISWHQGSVVMADNYVINGYMSPDYQLNILMVRTDEEVFVLHPYQIRTFRFFDTDMEINRKFEVLPFAGDDVFTEIVIDGDVRLLRILKKFQAPRYSDYLKDLYQRQIADFDYYISVENRILDPRQFNRFLRLRYGSGVRYMDDADLLSKLIMRINDLNNVHKNALASK